MKTFQAFYARKDYPNALLELEKLKPEMNSGLWHFNVGAIKAQTQNWAEARFHFLKAKDLGFNQDQNFQNLKLVEEKLEIGRLEKPLSIKDYVIEAGLWSTQGLFTSMALLILIVGILNFRKKRDYRTASLYAGLVLIPLGLNFWISSWDRDLVLEPQMVQEGPSAIFSSRTELPVGVMILSKDHGGWREVFYPSRFAGWIKSSGLKSLENE